MANATQTWNRQTAGSVSNRSIFAPVPAPIAPVRTLGRRLREARQAKGMTQAELGAVLGLEDENSAAPRISRYERGDRMPDEETMEALAEALGLPVAYFHATSDTLAEVILLVSKLPLSKQKEALKRLRELSASA
ncbi:helix-turn-helix transcriptional regulator [Stenotrophomonas maltophilia]|uniref:Helix-turn-helix domain-containing protein n=2 Tax=Stenotrophomonas forensis TaxID=2871169 RepID=A0ABY7Y3M1_9GAMM|nr:helix-turn-helix transcriptional regulator [Stenotrophomonas maltophilia]WDM64555.1 helix-turn-helix domain-containing protein [Stenotrophomonas sp. DFS-20110405]